MNYQNIYNLLINKATARSNLNGYKERHHIIPRSLGGNDDTENLVDLTAREHFIAHLLLAKIYGGKMIQAAYLMSTRSGNTNRTYARLKILFIERIKNNKERAKKISIALSNKPKSDAHKQAYKESRLKSGGWACSEERKEELKISMKGSGNHMWGKTHNDDARKRISDANLQKLICPHCKKEGGISIMKRWHLDNCKFAPVPKARKQYPKKVCPHCGKEGGGSQMVAKHFDNCQQK